MVTNKHRGEGEIEVAGTRLQLRFRRKQMILLADALGMDPLAWLSEQKGNDRFLRDAIVAGHSAFNKKFNEEQCEDLLDEHEGDDADLLKAILYMMARGKKGQASADMLKALDQQFGGESLGEASSSPDENGTSKPSTLMPKSSSVPSTVSPPTSIGN